jgi:MoxR-like ATPase
MRISEMMRSVQAEVSKAVVGQDEAAMCLMTALLARGHVLLEGVPGIAKTLLSRAVAQCIGAEFRRVQCTPDLMPADITGTNVFDLQERSFRLVRGPVFTNLLLVDEINRTPPKTQSALLQAMQERVVTIDGADHALDGAFCVIATQNPVEYEGTYPLPEAQLDRFLMKIVVGYPDQPAEQNVLRMHLNGLDPQDLKAAGVSQVLALQDLEAAFQELSQQTVRDDVLAYLLELVRRTRESPHALLGASPRAAVALLRCAQVRAAAQDREYVTPDDIQDMAHPVLRHRLILKPEAEIEGLTVGRLIDGIISAVPVPR